MFKYKMKGRVQIKRVKKSFTLTEFVSSFVPIYERHSFKISATVLLKSCFVSFLKQSQNDTQLFSYYYTYFHTQISATSSGQLISDDKKCMSDWLTAAVDAIVCDAHTYFWSSKPLPSSSQQLNWMTIQRWANKQALNNKCISMQTKTKATSVFHTRTNSFMPSLNAYIRQKHVYANANYQKWENTLSCLWDQTEKCKSQSVEKFCAYRFPRNWGPLKKRKY